MDSHQLESNNKKDEKFFLKTLVWKKYQLRFGMFNEKVNLPFRSYDCTRLILGSFFISVIPRLPSKFLSA